MAVVAVAVVVVGVVVVVVVVEVMATRTMDMVVVIMATAAGAVTDGNWFNDLCSQFLHARPYHRYAELACRRLDAHCVPACSFFTFQRACLPMSYIDFECAMYRARRNIGIIRFEKA
jgi:hypothetical protein